MLDGVATLVNVMSDKRGAQIVGNFVADYVKQTSTGDKLIAGASALFDIVLAFGTGGGAAAAKTGTVAAKEGVAVAGELASGGTRVAGAVEEVTAGARAAEAVENTSALGKALTALKEVEASLSSMKILKQAEKMGLDAEKLYAHPGVQAASAVERPGLLHSIVRMADRGWEVVPQKFSYSGNQGVDLVFRKTVDDIEQFAVVEAKNSRSLSALETYGELRLR